MSTITYRFASLLSALWMGLAFAPSALAQYGGGPGMNAGGPGWGGNMYMPFGGIFMIVLLVVVVVVVLLVLRNAVPRSHQPGAQSPLDVLKARYARGEIDRDTYLAIKRDFDGKSD